MREAARRDRRARFTALADATNAASSQAACSQGSTNCLDACQECFRSPRDVGGGSGPLKIGEPFVFLQAFNDTAAYSRDSAMPDPSADRQSPMPPATEAMHPASSLDTAAALVLVLDQYMAALKVGVAPDRARLLADHPQLAAQLEPCLAGIEFISRAARPASSPTQLGDFRIVRELGRGGMGVVYEAEQISLRRRVALKVLRFGAVADKEALERFRREAETVAHLHHTNIVPIFADHGTSST